MVKFVKWLLLVMATFIAVAFALIITGTCLLFFSSVSVMFVFIGAGIILSLFVLACIAAIVLAVYMISHGVIRDNVKEFDKRFDEMQDKINKVVDEQVDKMFEPDDKEPKK